MPINLDPKWAPNHIRASQDWGDCSHLMGVLRLWGLPWSLGGLCQSCGDDSASRGLIASCCPMVWPILVSDRRCPLGYRKALRGTDLSNKSNDKNPSVLLLASPLVGSSYCSSGALDSPIESWVPLDNSP